MDQCTLYITVASVRDFFPMVQETFPEWNAFGDGSSITIEKRKLFSKQSITFRIKSREEHGEEFDAMMRGMHGFYANIATEFERVKETLLAQIQIFTAVVAVTADKDMDDETFGSLLQLAGKAHGLLFLPPADLYNEEGDLVFNAAGESDLESHAVYGPSELIDQHVRVTESGEARKKRTNEKLANEGIPLCQTLPPIVGDEDFIPRSAKEIAERTLGILFIAAYADMLPEDGPDKARDHIGPMLDKYGACQFLSPHERAFLIDHEPDEADIIRYNWRYECAWAGFWVLGFVEELSYPSATCDIAFMADIARKYDSFDAFFADVKLRSPEDILDAADCIYRYDWAAVDARVNGRDAPGNLHPGVVLERHRMFNWLTRYMNFDWDFVRTDT